MMVGMNKSTRLAAYRKGWDAAVTEAGATHLLTTRLVLGTEYRGTSAARLEEMGRAEAWCHIAARRIEARRREVQP